VYINYSLHPVLRKVINGHKMKCNEVMVKAVTELNEGSNRI